MFYVSTEVSLVERVAFSDHRGHALLLDHTRCGHRAKDEEALTSGSLGLRDFERSGSFQANYSITCIPDNPWVTYSMYLLCASVVSLILWALGTC